MGPTVQTPMVFAPIASNPIPTIERLITPIATTPMDTTPIGTMPMQITPIGTIPIDTVPSGAIPTAKRLGLLPQCPDTGSGEEDSVITAW